MRTTPRQHCAWTVTISRVGLARDMRFRAAIVKAVRKHFKGLLVVGGGITTPQAAATLAEAGADLLVIGNLLETKDFESKLLPIVKV